MKFSEAVKLLEEGKKVRNVDWEEEDYIFFDIENEDIYTETCQKYSIEGSDFGEEWEEYIEPETEKIKMLSGLSLAFLTQTEINTSIINKINELIEVVNKLC